MQKLGELISYLRQLRGHWEVYLDNMDQRHLSTAYHAPVVHALGRGRPRFDITRDQLEYLSSLSFNWTQISALLGVSRMTVYRQRAEFDMLGDTSEPLTNDEVRRHVTNMRQQFPNIGESMTIGRLRAAFELHEIRFGKQSEQQTLSTVHSAGLVV